MSISHILTEPALAEFWRVHPNTPYYWRDAGILVADDKFGLTSCYLYPTIDAFHADPTRARNFSGPVPTMEALMAGEKPAMFHASEVAKLARISEEAVYRRVASGALAAIVLSPQAMRFPRPTVMAYLASLPDEDMTHPKDAAKVLGVGIAKVRSLVKDGLLAQVHNPNRPTYLFVSRQSVRGLLGTWLRGGMTVDAWWEQQVLGGKLLTRQQVIEQRHIAYKTIVKMLARKELVCIITDKGQVLIPEHIALTLGQEGVMYSAEEIKLFFGLDDTGYANIIRVHQYCKRDGGTRGFCGQQKCVRQYFERNRTSRDVTFDEWVSWITDNGILPVNAEVFLEGVAGRPIIDDAVDRRLLRGVRVLTRRSDEILAHPIDLRVLQRKLERELRGDDYTAHTYTQRWK